MKTTSRFARLGFLENVIGLSVSRMQRCHIRKNKVRSRVVEHRSRAIRKTLRENTRRVVTRFPRCSLLAWRNNFLYLVYLGRCSLMRCAQAHRRQPSQGKVNVRTLRHRAMRHRARSNVRTLNERRAVDFAPSLFGFCRCRAVLLVACRGRARYLRAGGSKAQRFRKGQVSRGQVHRLIDRRLNATEKSDI
jgi:hypothetical protein